MRAGYSNNGLGVRLNADWQSATTVNAGTAGAPQQLRFGSLATFDLRLFADLGQQRDFVRDHRWARGTRIRSEEHTSELQSLMRISYAVFCLKKKNQTECRKETRSNEHETE